MSFLQNHYPDWVASGDLQRVIAEKTEYTPRTAVRRLQEMANRGVLMVELRAGHAFYRYNPDSLKFGNTVSSTVVRDVKKIKEVFLTPCSFCGQQVPTSPVTCIYCKNQKGLLKAPVHHLCMDCFIKGHSED
jgi:hypothetical protein